MSFSDHPTSPPSPFMSLPFVGDYVGGFWPQPLIDNEQPDTHSQFEHVPPFKRPRNFESNPPNSTPFPHMSLRMNPPVVAGCKGTSHIFFKTRMCAKFLEGNCRNGEHCTFAHGAEDLREPPPNWQELVRERDRVGNWNDDQRIIHRMKICKKFYNGEECPYGEKCNFLHEPPSKFKTDMVMPTLPRESSAISIGTMGPIMGHRDGSDQPEINKHVNGCSDALRVNMKPVFWKTRICSKWETSGQFPFGERCHFAHGQSELQVPSGLVEAEMMMNMGSIPAKPLAVPSNDAAPANTVTSASTKEEGVGKKGLSKWKLTKKMNRIYADWIDDLTPPHILPSEVEK
ncbi:unnamed protein product [Ilex paraguariensis]|uniref:C3H1-type domain-containing protein n=1 Tax=Ilex paraguariensis TaxID=185542 RepID=A0ABC8QN87_9AQUA